MTTREREIFLLIKDNTMITQEEIAEKLGISRSAVSVHISSLLRQGLIRGRGYVINEERYHVVIGTAGMDFTGTIEGKSSDSVTEKIINYYGRININYGGAAYNISECLSQLGENVRMISPISSDIFGKQIIERCREQQINTDDCLYLPEISQSVMLQLRNEDKDQIISMDNYFSEVHMTPEFFAQKTDILRNANSIVITDIISPESAEFLLSVNNSNTWFVFSGVTSRIKKHSHNIGKVAHLYVNLQAAAHIANLPLSVGYEAIAKRFCELGIHDAFISCDNRMIVHVTQKDGYKCYTPIPGVRSDSERGKDGFVSGLISTSTGNHSMTDRIRYASAVSLLSLKKEKSMHSILNKDSVLQILQMADSQL